MIALCETVPYLREREATHGCNFVGSVVVDMHRWILVPARNEPIDQILKGALFLLGIMGPKGAKISLPVSKVGDAKEVL